MKHGFIKVSAAAPKIRVADIEGNISEVVRLIKEAAERGAKIIVFPELSVTGATAGDLFLTKTLLSAAENAAAYIADATEELDIFILLGLPVLLSGKVYNAAVAMHRGEILGIVPKSSLSSSETRYFSIPKTACEVDFAGRETLFGSDILFTCSSLDELTVGVSVGSEIYAPLSPARFAAAAGATLILNPYSSPELVGRRESDGIFLSSESRALKAAIVRAESGKGESGTDGCYSGASRIACLGKICAEAEPFKEELIFADIDIEYLARERFGDSAFDDAEGFELVNFSLDIEDNILEKKPKKLVFVPDSACELKKRCGDILEIQAQALAARIERSYSKGAVVGVSGGLDSTLALLVAVKAMEILKRPITDVAAITMPCFGTTSRTKSNAERLAESLGASLRCIDIKAAVNQHFEDIGHSADDLSVVYENSQARERTQVLMDVANALGALVVGTGDLSELALGWATYNGDHMSMYGVNAGVPKTLMRHIVSYCADLYEQMGKNEVAAVLRDVLATPVSPELLPPKDGEIAQCTEGIVGPYELHDFFLYYHVRRGYSPEKILRLAALAFEGEYTEEVIKGWLKVFMRRFFSQQFKRSCLPDGPKIGSVGFSPRGDFKMPSDSVGKLWEI